MRRMPADLLLLVVVLVWSFHFAVIKYALESGFGPIAYAAIRFGVGSFLFAGIAYGAEGSLRVGRRDLWLLAGVLGVSLYVNQMAFATSLERASASTVALLFGTLPIFVALIGWRLGVEHPGRRYLGAAALSFAGVALVAAETEGGLSGGLGGILIGLVAPITWALFSVLAAPMMTRYSPSRISAVVGLVATPLLVLTAIPQFRGMDWASLGALAWGALLYSMLVAFVFTNVLWFRAIRRVGASRAALYSNLQPFLGAVFAVLALSESLAPLQILGGAIIALGLVLARPRRPPAEVID